MRCDGIRTANNQTCGSPVFRCKDCGHMGCNQGSENVCSKQGFRTARCKSCNKLGSNRLVKDDEPAAASS